MRKNANPRTRGNVAKQSSRTLSLRKKAKRLLTSTLTLMADTAMEVVSGSIRKEFAIALLNLLVEAIKSVVRGS